MYVVALANAITWREGASMGTVIEWIVVVALFVAGLVLVKNLVMSRSGTWSRLHNPIISRCPGTRGN
jgi:hypothetical protein